MMNKLLLMQIVKSVGAKSFEFSEIKYLPIYGILNDPNRDLLIILFGFLFGERAF